MPDVRPRQADSGSEGRSEKLQVFISYSRDDLEIADWLDVMLESNGFAPILDRHGISGAENWQHRLGGMIRDADTIVFVVSPSSAKSAICKWEVAEAARLGKRIVPVLAHPLDGAAAPPELAALNYIFLYVEPKRPGSGIKTGTAELIRALKIDLGWMREHTRYLQRAIEWESGGKQPGRLLSGSDVAEAKAWAARRPKDTPASAALVAAFIDASERWQSEQADAQRRQLEERERLVKDREAAQADRDVQARRARQRTRMGLAATALLLAVAAGLAVWALNLRSDASLQRADATTQREQADKARSETAELARQAAKDRAEALKNQSEYLAGLAADQTEKEDASTGLLLALEALPDQTSEDVAKRNRPYVSAAEVSLEAARRLLRERGVLNGHCGAVTSVAVTADGTRIVTGSWDTTARVWDAMTFAELGQLNGHTESVNSVAVTADGTRIVTGTYDKTVRVWEVHPFGPALIADAQHVAPRCLTLDQRRLYHLSPSPPRWCESMQKWPFDALTVAEDHVAAGRYREAIAAFEKAIALDAAARERHSPTLASLHARIAAITFLDVTLNRKPATELNAALADADKALTFAPNDRDTLDTRGQIRLALGQIDLAFTDLDRAITLGINAAGTYYARGRAHELKGNRDPAIADYRIALELFDADKNPDDDDKLVAAQAHARLVALGVASEGVADKQR